MSTSHVLFRFFFPFFSNMLDAHVPFIWLMKINIISTSFKLVKEHVFVFF